jgi:pimeloyl-ACP methyl ester carboxylesterase
MEKERHCKMKKIAVLFFILIAPNICAQNRITDFSLKKLLTYQYRTSPVTIQKLVFKNELQYAYNVTYTSMNLTVSARLSVPNTRPENIKGIVIMLRGHQHPGNYYTGKGTENPARGYLRSGWAVIAPDFFGFGSSSQTPPPFSLHQFYSTINAVELYKSLETVAVSTGGNRSTQAVFVYSSAVPQADRVSLPENFKKIVLWGHSNGGQIALHFLIIIQKPVTTVLWAPVSLGYPESAGHYGMGGEWVERFRRDYPANDFSLYTYLDKIAPDAHILLEQGDRDRAVPKVWSDNLAKAIEEENLRRERTGRGKINLRYEIYPNADHNLNPYWNTVLPRDAAFWEQY